MNRKTGTALRNERSPFFVAMFINTSFYPFFRTSMVLPAIVVTQSYLFRKQALTHIC